MDEKQPQDIEIIEISDECPKCYACGNDVKQGSLLVCAECLDVECGNFEKIALENE